MKISKNPALSFSANAKDVALAISRVHSLNQTVNCLDTDRFMLMAVIEKNPYIIGITPDSFAMQKIQNADVSSEGAFVFDVTTINGLLKNRDGISITGDKSSITIAALKGKYTARTEIAEIADEHIMRIKASTESQKANKLKSAVIEAIRNGVKCAELTNFYSDDVILAFITVGEKGIRVDCADNFHVASYVDKTPSERKFRIALPVKTFTLIDKFIGESDAKFSTDESQLRVEGKDFTVIMPATQVDEDMFDLVPSYLKTLTKPITEFNLTAEALKITDNIFAIITEDTKMSLTVKSKSAKIEMTTRNGSVSESFKVAATGREHVAHIDPKIFGDLIKKIKGDELPFSFFEGAKGTTGCFRVISRPSKTSRLTQIGTFYAE